MVRRALARAVINEAFLGGASSAELSLAHPSQHFCIGFRETFMVSQLRQAAEGCIFVFDDATLVSVSSQRFCFRLPDLAGGGIWQR